RRAFVKGGSKLGLGRSRGSRPSTAIPITVARPPNRIVSSNAITTKGGIETTGLPPVVSPHCIADQIVSRNPDAVPVRPPISVKRSEEHTSELQSLRHLVCRLLLEKKKKRAR